jgi:hypothetical protein
MDHVRGSSLVWPATLDTLRPFILTWWSGRTVNDMPADVRAVYDDADLGGQHINIALVLLDERGRVLRASVPSVRPGEFRFDPEAQGKDFKRQLDELVKGLALPKVEVPPTRKLTLPDLCTEGKPSGVRIYLTAAQNRLNHYRTPIVEAVPITDAIRSALRYPTAEAAVTAKDLEPWLQQIYPAAIMDGRGGFRSIEGTLSLRPAGQDTAHRYAVLEGEIYFQLDNTSRSRYLGDLAFVLKYSLESRAVETVRGVIHCTVPKGPDWISLVAALESLPE